MAIVPTAMLAKEPYASVVCYPHANATEIEQRIAELQRHGIEAVEFSGCAGASNVPILGKGYVGVVVIAHIEGKRVALKMRRIDADRVDLTHEAEMLQKANSVGVGPKFIAASNNFLLSELVDGYLLFEWLIGQGKYAVRKNVLDVLEQCWRLDGAGLDHGELSKAPKHILVNKAGKPFIVDFETASVTRRVINVTSVCQFFFQGNSETCKTIASTLGEKNKEKLIEALRAYKKERNRANFERILCIALA
jgi:putative serine/threonine protein kinase